jgi:hypothetical protein
MRFITNLGHFQFGFDFYSRFVAIPIYAPQLGHVWSYRHDLNNPSANHQIIPPAICTVGCGPGAADSGSKTSAQKINLKPALAAASLAQSGQRSPPYWCSGNFPRVSLFGAIFDQISFGTL